MKGHIFQSAKRKFCLLLVLGLCGLGTACGDAPQAVSESGEEQEHHYSIQLREIPDPDQALYESDIMEGHEDCQVLERKRVYQNGCIYRFLAIMNEAAVNIVEQVSLWYGRTFFWVYVQDDSVDQLIFLSYQYGAAFIPIAP